MGGVRKGGGWGAGERDERAVVGVTCTELTNSHGGSSRGEVGRAANFRGIKEGEGARGLTAGARKPEEEGKRKGEGSWGGMDGGGVSGAIRDTRRSTGSRGVQGPGRSAGAAGGIVGSVWFA